MQYLACGKAVVATRLPGMVTVISGEDEGVIYCDSVEEMPAELVALIESKDNRQRLERSGLAYVRQKHSNESIAHQLEEKLEELIKDTQDNS